MFDPATVQNWYPFNLSYDYELFKEREIKLTQKTKATYTPKIKDMNMLNTIMWYNKYVRDDNLRVAEFSTALGIASPFNYYTSRDVTDSFITLGNAIDALTVHHTQKYMEATGKSFSINLEGEALRKLSEDGKALYARLGEVYTMLSVMRKVTTINGVARPIKPPIWATD